MNIANIINELRSLDAVSRDREKVYRRIILAKILTDAGLYFSEVGRIMNKNHATVIYYKKQFENLMKYRDFKLLYNEIN
jgi:chromosomal replication initiation ATPase DnaA